MRYLPSITGQEAQRAIGTIANCVKNDCGNAVSIAVVDACGNLLAFLNTGAKPITVGLAIAKAKTALKVEKATIHLHLAGTNPAMYADPEITCFGGGVPIMIEGAVAGAIGVSGRKAGRVFLIQESNGGAALGELSAFDIVELDSDRLQDHELADLGAAAVMRAQVLSE